MNLEIYLGLLIVAVIVFAMWALVTVFTATFGPDDDVLDEVESESAYTDALKRL